MQISVKVITANSQIYEMAVDNELSVREFKDVVASKTSIDPAHQRIIFGGRMLLDQCKLKYYDLGGKMMHVVEQQNDDATVSEIQNEICNTIMRQQLPTRARNAAARQVERTLRRGRSAATSLPNLTTNAINSNNNSRDGPADSSTSIASRVKADKVKDKSRN